MKKIIATVLAMVMALALCTTAFAASATFGSVESKSVDLTGAKFYKLGDASTGNMTAVTDEVTAVLKTTHGKDVSAKGVSTYYADKYTLTVTADSANGAVHMVAGDYYAVAKDYADFMMVLGGTKVYVKSNISNALSTSLFITKTIDKAATPTCGDCVVNNAADPLVGAKVWVSDEDDAYLAADDTTSVWAIFNGEFIMVGAAVAATNVVAHNFKAANVTYKGTDAAGHAIPVSIKCPTCNKTFNVVKDKDNEWKNGDYVVGTATDVGTNYYIVLTNGSTTPSTGTTTTTSPKTFDAGIAMYVGMALTSVAGSAVVIGKKKEF